MKVLLVNVNAISGSTGKIVTDIKTVLEAEGHECVIAYGNSVTVNKKGYFRFCDKITRKFNSAISRITGIKYGYYLNKPYRNLKHFIGLYKPDIVHIHCPNAYSIDLFKLLDYLAISRIKTVVTNHAEFFYTGGCGYAYDCKKWQNECFKCPQNTRYINLLDPEKITFNKFLKVFNKFDKDNIYITSVSPWVDRRSKISSIQGSLNSCSVLNGVNTRIFNYKDCEHKFKDIYVNKHTILHVSASFTDDSFSVKGGLHLIRLAKIMPDYKFIVVSPSIKISKKLPENILIIGSISNQVDLAELYRTADVTVLTSKRETFSMVVAESLCCGTPIVGFKAGGPESITIPEYSSFVEFGDIELLKLSIEKIINSNFIPEDISAKSIKKFSKEGMTDKYINIYYRLLK